MAACSAYGCTNRTSKKIPGITFYRNLTVLVCVCLVAWLFTLVCEKMKHSESTGEIVSIFVFEVTSQETQLLLDIAKAAVKRLKTLRHPSILTYIDSLETDKLIYLVTEQVDPLELHLTKELYTDAQRKLAISWGLHQIACGLGFLNKDCNLSHNNVCLASVFVDRAGEWHLGGVEYMAPSQDLPPFKAVCDLKKYSPPERESSYKGNKGHNWSRDSWGLGCLIWETFNGPLPRPASLKTLGKIPQNLAPQYCELVCANPSSRPSSLEFLKKSSSRNGFLKNKFVETLLFLKEIHIKDNEEKTLFFNGLTSVLDMFPQDISQYKILPELLNAFEFGNAGSAVLSPLFKLGKLLSEEDYQQKIVPCVVKMFSSKDRATRAKLLQQMEEFIDHLQPAVINDQIFPNVAQGFLDTSPVIREQTIKCMLYLAPKLNYKNLNEEMLKHFARLQVKDEQGGIRTNTTVCLGKIATHFHPLTRKKVLIHAFMRAMRDPFTPARTAAILAFSATQNYYTVNDCATRVLPALCHMTIDPEKSVRDQAFKAISGFLQKLEKVSEDPSLADQVDEETRSLSPSSLASSWTSWAVTSLTDKLYRSTTSKNSPTTPTSPVASTENEPKAVEIQKESNVDKWAEEIVDENEWNVNDWKDTEIDSEDSNRTKRLMAEPTESSQLSGEWDDQGWESFENTDIQNVAANEEKNIYFPTTEEQQLECLSNDKRKKTSSFSSNTLDEWDMNKDQWNDWGDSITNESYQRIEKTRHKQKERLSREEERKQKQKARQSSKAMKLGAQKLT